MPPGCPATSSGTSRWSPRRLGSRRVRAREAPGAGALLPESTSTSARRAARGVAKAMIARGRGLGPGRRRGHADARGDHLERGRPARVRAARLRGGVPKPVPLARGPRDALSPGRQRAPSFGSIHVQTDDAEAVVRAVMQFVPRLPGGSRGGVVLKPQQRLDRRLRRALRPRAGRCCGGSHASCPTGWVRSCSRSASRRARSSATSSSSGAASSTSTRPCPSTTARCLPGEVIALEREPDRARAADRRRPAARARGRPDRGDARPSSPPPLELLAGLAAVLGVEGATARLRRSARDPRRAPLLDV